MTKKLTPLAIILILFAISAWSEEVRNEVTIQGSGFFQKQTTNGGITNEPSNKTPDFEQTSLKVDNYTHSAVPSAGLVLTF
jgi:hypothetical protein